MQFPIRHGSAESIGTRIIILQRHTWRETLAPPSAPASPAGFRGGLERNTLEARRFDTDRRANALILRDCEGSIFDAGQHSDCTVIK